MSGRFDWPAFLFAAALVAGFILLLCLAAIGCEESAARERRGGAYVRVYGKLNGYVCVEMKPK